MASKLVWKGKDLKAKALTVSADTLLAAATVGRDVARQTAHVITGELRDSIYLEAGPSRARFGARSMHGVYERRRGGTHDFLAPAIQAAMARIAPAVADAAAKAGFK